MWQLQNHTPFPADTGFYRSHDGGAFWGLWVAADFQVRVGQAPLFVTDQTPLAQSPEFGPDEQLIRDAEKTPPRQEVDVIVQGHAMQPDATSHQPKRIGVRLGTWHKELHLFPPLKWGRMGQPRVDTAADPQRVNVDGTASFGGREHPENPLGWGHPSGHDDLRTRAPAPLHCAGYQPPKEGASVPPGRFGPVSPLWPVRTALGGTYDTTWQSQRAPLLPADFNPAFWQSAPADQRLPHTGPTDLAIDAYGFDTLGTGDQPTRFFLPAPIFGCDTRIGPNWEKAKMTLQSITLDFDHLRVRLIYHAAWELRRAEDDVQVSRTVLSLIDTQSFRALPQDAPRFNLSLSATPDRRIT